MLVLMVIFFAISWLPLNLLNLLVDFYRPISSWPYLNLLFLLSHLIAMSSVCYNPILYAFMSDSFRKEIAQSAPIVAEKFRRRSHVPEIDMPTTQTEFGKSLLPPEGGSRRPSGNSMLKTTLTTLPEESSMNGLSLLENEVAV